MDDVWSTLGVVAIVLIAVMVVVVVALVVGLVRKHRAVHRPETPFSAKFSYWASIVYTVVPVDLLPDPILVDDIGVLSAALLYVGHVTRKIARREP